MAKLSLITLKLQDNQILCTITAFRKVEVFDKFVTFRMPNRSSSLHSISRSVIERVSHTLDFSTSSMYVQGKVTREHAAACLSILLQAMESKRESVQKELQDLSAKMDTWKKAESNLLYTFTHNH